MFDFQISSVSHLFVAALTGFISGFLVSFPVGPINLTILNEGARRGFKWAALIGMGAVLMETIYCGLAFMGISTFFTNTTVKAAVELISFLLMLYLGLKFIRAKAVEEHNQIEEKIEKKLHPHSAFMTGFVRVLGNPGVLVLWISLTAVFMSHDWVDDNQSEKIACVAGVCAGTAAWFLLLSFAVSLGHKKFSSKTLLRMEHISGILLLGIALVLGIRLVIMLEHSKWRKKHHDAEPVPVQTVTNTPAKTVPFL